MSWLWASDLSFCLQKAMWDFEEIHRFYWWFGKLVPSICGKHNTASPWSYWGWGCAAAMLCGPAVSMASAWKNTSSYRGLLVCWCCYLHMWQPAVQASLQIWKNTQFTSFGSLQLYGNQIQKWNWKLTKEIQRALPCIISKGLDLLYFPHSKHCPWLSSQGIVPINQSPSTILSVCVDKDTTLFFTCISQTEPESRDWLLNGPSALCLG